MKKEDIDRINELARKAKADGTWVDPKAAEAAKAEAAAMLPVLEALTADDLHY